MAITSCKKCGFKNYDPYLRLGSCGHCWQDPYMPMPHLVLRGSTGLALLVRRRPGVDVERFPERMRAGLLSDLSMMAGWGDKIRCIEVSMADPDTNVYRLCELYDCTERYRKKGESEFLEMFEPVTYERFWREGETPAECRLSEQIVFRKGSFKVAAIDIDRLMMKALGYGKSVLAAHSDELVVSGREYEFKRAMRDVAAYHGLGDLDEKVVAKAAKEFDEVQRSKENYLLPGPFKEATKDAESLMMRKLFADMSPDAYQVMLREAIEDLANLGLEGGNVQRPSGPFKDCHVMLPVNTDDGTDFDHDHEPNLKEAKLLTCFDAYGILPENTKVLTTTRRVLHAWCDPDGEVDLVEFDGATEMAALVTRWQETGVLFPKTEDLVENSNEVLAALLTDVERKRRVIERANAGLDCGPTVAVVRAFVVRENRSKRYYAFDASWCFHTFAGCGK